jgi:hypothetical protein
MAKKEPAVQSDVGRSQMADGNSSGDGIEETVDSPSPFFPAAMYPLPAESIDADSSFAYDGAITQEQRERMIAEGRVLHRPTARVRSRLAIGRLAHRRGADRRFLSNR